MSTVPEVRTDRLLLRGWRDEDREPFAALNADPVVMEHFPAPLARGESDAFVDHMIASWHERGSGLWAVEVVEDPGCIGFVGLNHPGFVADFTPCIEIGWRLRRAAWGRGYAPEAARAALQFGWDVVGLAEIQSWTTTANVNSRRVMEKIGMTRDPADDFDHPALAEGHPQRRHVRYRITRPPVEVVGSQSAR